MRGKTQKTRKIVQKIIFFGPVSRSSCKNVNLLAQFGGEICVLKLKKKFLESCEGVRRGLTVETSKKHIYDPYYMFIVHTKSQFASSTFWGEKRGTAIFQGQKRKNPSHLPF